MERYEQGKERNGRVVCTIRPNHVKEEEGIYCCMRRFFYVCSLFFVFLLVCIEDHHDAYVYIFLYVSHGNSLSTQYHNWR